MEGWLEEQKGIWGRRRKRKKKRVDVVRVEYILI